MKPDRAATARQPAENKPARHFTVESANRSLVLVRKVVQEIVDEYARVLEMRAQREELARARGARQRLDDLGRRIERSVATLNHLHEELSEIGCELKDWATGLVDFPARHQGRAVMLCWRLGEPTIAFWHEPDAGFSGRQPITAEFGTAES